MGFLIQMNSCCGFELRRASTIILQLYFFLSGAFLVKHIVFSYNILKEDGSTMESILISFGVAATGLLILVIPSALGLYGIACRRRSYLTVFLWINIVLIVLTFLALIIFVLKTLWMLIQVAFKAEPIGDDIISMGMITTVTIIVFSFLYFFTCVVHSFYNIS